MNKQSKKTVLISGGAGKMGTLIIDYLSSQDNYEIIGIYDPSYTLSDYPSIENIEDNYPDYILEFSPASAVNENLQKWIKTTSNLLIGSSDVSEETLSLLKTLDQKSKVVEIPNITIGAATATTEASSQDTDTQVMGIKVASGNRTAAVSQSTVEKAATAAVAGTASTTLAARVAPVAAVDKADEESIGAAVSFAVNDGMTITVHTAETDDGQTTESYSNAGIEIAYTIAPGLKATINVEDYDYKAGNSTNNSNNAGTASKLTIKASF